MCAAGTRRRREAACAGVGAGGGLPPLAGGGLGGLPQEILKFQGLKNAISCNLRMDLLLGYA